MARARNSRSDKTLDAVLKEVKGLKRRAEELREWRALAIRGPIGAIGSWPGPGPYSGRGYTPDEIAQLEGVAEYVQQCDEAIRELEREIQDKWALAGGLQDAPDRLAGSDDEIAAQAVALEARRQALAARTGLFREDAHAAVDAGLAEYRQRIDALLAQPRLGAFELESLMALWPARDPSFAEALHGAIDARPAAEFATGARSSWEAEVALLGRQAERRRRELLLREQEREAREAEARRAEAELALAETT